MDKKVKGKRPLGKPTSTWEQWKDGNKERGTRGKNEEEEEMEDRDALRDLFVNRYRKCKQPRKKKNEIKLLVF
jgi:hypothetical protein